MAALPEWPTAQLGDQQGYALRGGWVYTPRAMVVRGSVDTALWEVVRPIVAAPRADFAGVEMILDGAHLAYVEGTLDHYCKGMASAITGFPIRTSAGLITAVVRVPAGERRRADLLGNARYDSGALRSWWHLRVPIETLELVA